MLKEWRTPEESTIKQAPLKPYKSSAKPGICCDVKKVKQKECVFYWDANRESKTFTKTNAKRILLERRLRLVTMWWLTDQYLWQSCSVAEPYTSPLFIQKLKESFVLVAAPKGIRKLSIQDAWPLFLRLQNSHALRQELYHWANSTSSIIKSCIGPWNFVRFLWSFLIRISSLATHASKDVALLLLYCTRVWNDALGVTLRDLLSRMLYSVITNVISTELTWAGLHGREDTKWFLCSIAEASSKLAHA